MPKKVKSKKGAFSSLSTRKNSTFDGIMCMIVQVRLDFAILAEKDMTQQYNCYIIHRKQCVASSLLHRLAIQSIRVLAGKYCSYSLYAYFCCLLLLFLPFDL